MLVHPSFQSSLSPKRVRSIAQSSFVKFHLDSKSHPLASHRARMLASKGLSTGEMTPPPPPSHTTSGGWSAAAAARTSPWACLERWDTLTGFRRRDADAFLAPAAAAAPHRGTESVPGTDTAHGDGITDMRGLLTPRVLGPRSQVPGVEVNFLVLCFLSVLGSHETSGLDSEKTRVLSSRHVSTCQLTIPKASRCAYRSRPTLTFGVTFRLRAATCRNPAPLLPRQFGGPRSQPLSNRELTPKMVLIVETQGTFVYRALSCLGLRCRPDVSDESMMPGKHVDAGALVAVECVQPSRIGSNNGPFLRLANGDGWLFERKCGDVVMRREAVEQGLWAYRAGAYTRPYVRSTSAVAPL